MIYRVINDCIIDIEIDNDCCINDYCTVSYFCTSGVNLCRTCQLQVA